MTTLINFGFTLIESAKKLKWLPGFLTRIAIGYVFITSGWGKLQHLDKVIGFFSSLGMPYAHVLAPFVAVNEFLFGLLLFFGLAARFSCIPLSIIMVVALVTAKKEDIHEVADLFSIYEFLYIIMMSWVLIDGPGKFSIDHLLSKILETPRGKRKKN